MKRKRRGTRRAMLAVPICLLFLAFIPMPQFEDSLDAPDALPAQVQTMTEIPAAQELTATLAEAIAVEESVLPAATDTSAPTEAPTETAATLPPLVPETPAAEASLTPEATQAPTPEALQTDGSPVDTADLKGELLAAVEAKALAAQAEGALSGGDIGFRDFTTVVLDGTLQRTTAIWSIGDVVDSTGTGNGWNVSLTLTQFQESTGTGYVLLGDMLQTASLTVAVKPTVTGLDDQTTPAEQIAVVAVTTALDTGTPVTLLASGNGQGMGSYSISSFTVRLTVPADAYAHTYRTSATIALIASP